MKVQRLWTYDAALQSLKPLKPLCIKTPKVVELNFDRVFTTFVNDELQIWKPVLDDLGRIYYWNPKTMETRWSYNEENVSLTNTKVVSNIPFSYCDKECLENHPLFKKIRNIIE